MKHKTLQLKPQDIILALKLILTSGSDWRMTDIAQDLFISQSEVSTGLKRLMQAKLIDSAKKNVLRANLYEFLIHGLKYAFPASLGSVQRGIVTAYSAEPIASLIQGGAATAVVWPWGEGDVRGEALVPLYPTLPQAAMKDPDLYRLLSLSDTLRIGRAREQKLAAQELKKAIMN